MDNHALLRNMMFLDTIGIPSSGIEYNLSISDQDYRQVDELLTRFDVTDSKPIVSINPGAKWQTKLWDNQKFAILADRLIESLNAQVVFTGSLEDLSIIENIEDEMKDTAANLAGKTTLKMLAGLYARSTWILIKMHIMEACLTAKNSVC